MPQHCSIKIKEKEAGVEVEEVGSVREGGNPLVPGPLISLGMTSLRRITKCSASARQKNGTSSWDH